jgi:cytidylate kinase
MIFLLSEKKYFIKRKRRAVMTREALIRELSTSPKFRILSELGREIADKVRNTNFKKVIAKSEEDPEIEQEMDKFRQELVSLGITSVEGTLVGNLSSHDLYQKVVFPISIYFLREIPRD